MIDLPQRIKQHITTQRLLKRGERVVVAVSGGMDSMVLLNALHALAPGFGWKLSVAHFNHLLRGRSSDADERLVLATAKRLKLSSDVAAADVRKVAMEQGVSIEMAARQLRHEFLAQCARKRGARAVALAHHADDQVELFLLRLLRGAGGDGLGGMKARNPSPADQRISLIRPLLDFSKEEIGTFARAARIQFREDASNASQEFERNWVRLELLPMLRKRQPGVGKNILRAMQIVGAEAEFVTMVAGAWHKHEIGKQATLLERLPVAVQRRIVQSQIRGFGVDTDFQLVEGLRSMPNQPLSVGSKLALSCDPSGVVRRVEPGPSGFEAGEQVVALSGKRLKPELQPHEVNFAGRRLKWSVLRRTTGFSPKREAGREVFDADKIGARMVLRHWRAGDRFQPIGLASTTKLQDWFTNRKIPAARRRQLVLAETERGEVFWVEGERLGEVCKVTPATRRLLELRWKQA